MKLHSLISEEHALAPLEATTLEGAVRELLGAIADKLGKVSFDEQVARIMKRETEDPSVVEGWVALLHLRLADIKTFLVAAGVPAAPIDHPSDPNAKLRLIFLILAPQEQNTLMLQTMAAVGRLMESKAFVSAVRSAKTPARLIRLIEESGVEVKRTLTAGDVMEPVEHSVRLDTPISEAVRVLVKARDEGVPVVDERGRLAGEITTKEIIQFGMPRYMDLLTNPAMLNSFEPFENYFVEEGKTQVRDICRRDFVAVAPSDPIVQVAHKMIAQNRRRVYVLVDERIEGVVYRKSIVARVLNR